MKVGRPDGAGPHSGGEDPSLLLPGEPAERAWFWRWPRTPEFSPQRGQPFAKISPTPIVKLQKTRLGSAAALHADVLLSPSSPSPRGEQL